MMRASGAADAAAAGIVRVVGGRVLAVLALVGLPLFAVGMFVGLAGVAVLSAGVFAVPALRRVGFEDATIAAFIAVMATAGMIAPPMNVPAMLLADCVNMPWSNLSRACWRWRCRARRGAHLIYLGVRPGASAGRAAKGDGGKRAGAAR
jgi:TRAP-type C4-dicarboxylate transport system permease large subunit